MGRTKTRYHTTEVTAAGRSISLALSACAQEQLAIRAEPLVAEAEILFSCLVRKQLTFRDTSPDLLSWPVTEGLHLAVRPVLYEMCLPEGGSAVPEIVDFPVHDIVALIPKTFEVDFQDGSFTGSFTLG